MATGIISGNVLAAGVASVSLTPASVGATTTAEQSFTLPGARVGDFVSVSPPGQTAGVTLEYARVTAPDTVAVQFSNVTAGSLTPPAGLHQFFLVRPESVRTNFSP